MLPRPPTRLGLGLAAIARPAYITAGRRVDLGSSRSVDELRRRTQGLLDAALALGLRYIDVARSYGRAEEFLSGWLGLRPDADVTVGSKWGYEYVGGWRIDAPIHEIKDHSLATFVRQSSDSLALLGRRLGIYHVHSATLETGVLDDEPLHRALASLRERGVRVGVSVSGPRQTDAVRRALEIEVDGLPLFTSIQATWNVLEPSSGDSLAEAAAAGCVVIVKEAVANGRLTSHGEEPGFRVIADRLGLRPDAVAIAAALAQPWATCVLSGAVTVEQLASNVSALTVRLDEAVLEELASLAEPAEDYWAARSARPWA
ncbi:MAG: aldo/keto reductase [Acidimicrobiales bacterium]